MLNIALDKRLGSHKPKKWKCPSPHCRKKRYVRYYNFDTMEYLPYEFGKCDRENNCGYFNKPDSNYFKSLYENESYDTVKNHNIAPPKKIHASSINTPPFSTIPHDKFKATLKYYEHNYFYLFLEHKFGNCWASKIANMYHLGTSRQWPGANIFWQVDENGLIRTGKIMLHDPDSGRRSKYHFNFVHSLYRPDNYQLKQCLFGQHLLSQVDDDTKIAIVEGEKTAMIASYFFRDIIWLATGGETLLNEEKCKVLQNRKVVFFPDLEEKARKRWTHISQEVNQKYNIQTTVSDYKAEINDGSDIADHLLDQLPIDKTFGNVLNELGYPDDWD
ncbi:DUF6371 domain-containing protein [Catalinimonas sp. 4WD22]|uniref:DUF6371 domain-containing protein n=1 Tax=Catalinimonas locisalis TaxID=3133978 RepID=UPI0031012063